MVRTDVIIIGAGVVGLATARACAKKGFSAIVIEKHETFGRETSSRNSEVIHAGIYYHENSLKAKLCVEGNKMIYDICRENHLPHSNCGKLIVALTPNDERTLQILSENSVKNGAPRVKLISRAEALRLEPNIECKAALHCSTTGIVDTHSFMQFLEADAVNAGASFGYASEVCGLEFSGKDWKVSVRERDSSISIIFSSIVINCAGLYADNIASLAGIDIDKAGYRQFFRKGMYFRVFHGLEQYPKMLIYPAPTAHTVGIHTTPDLAGGMRLGPHFIPVEKFDYFVDEDWRQHFYENAKRFLPFLKFDDIQPDMAGIHPELFSQGNIWQDFIIKHEKDLGLAGLINLIGMGSPGLTSAPAIAEMVSDMVQDIL